VLAGGIFGRMEGLEIRAFGLGKAGGDNMQWQNVDVKMKSPISSINYFRNNCRK
jgi:hypothetical protein